MTITAGLYVPSLTRRVAQSPGEELVARLAADAVAAVLEVDPASLTPETRLDTDLGADSLALVEIVEIVEERCRARLGAWFTIADRDLPGLVTVGALARYVAVRARG